MDKAILNAKFNTNPKTIIGLFRVLLLVLNNPAKDNINNCDLFPSNEMCEEQHFQCKLISIPSFATYIFVDI